MIRESIESGINIGYSILSLLHYASIVLCAITMVIYAIILYVALLTFSAYKYIKLLTGKFYFLNLELLWLSLTIALISTIFNFTELNTLNNYNLIFISIIVSYVLYVCTINVYNHNKEYHKKSLKEELGNLKVVFVYIILVSIIRISFLLTLNINSIVSFVLTIVCVQTISIYIFSILRQRSLPNKNYSIFNVYMVNTIKFSWLIFTIMLSCFIYKYNPIYNILIYLQGIELLFPLYGSIGLIKSLYKDFINYYLGNYNGINQLNRRSNFWKHKLLKDNNKIISYNNWNPVSKFLPLPTFIKGVNNNILFNTVIIDVNNININPNILLSIFDKCNGIKLNYFNYINNKLCVNINYVNSCYNVTIKNVILDVKDYINYSVNKNSSLELSKIKLCKDIDEDIKDFEKMLNKKYNDKLVKNIIDSTNKDLMIFPVVDNADPYIERLKIQIDDIKNRYANRLDLDFMSQLFELFQNNRSLMINNVNPNDFLLFSNNRDICQGLYCKIYLDTTCSYYLPYNPHTFHNDVVVLFKKEQYGGFQGGIFLPETIGVANPLWQATKFCLEDGQPLDFNNDVVRFRELLDSKEISSNAYYNCNGELIILPWKFHNYSYIDNVLDSNYRGQAGLQFMIQVEENYNKNIYFLNKHIDHNSKFYFQALNLINKFPTWMFDPLTLKALYEILTYHTNIDNYKSLRIYGFGVGNDNRIGHWKLGNSDIQIITNSLQHSYDNTFQRYYPTDWSTRKYPLSVADNVWKTPDFNLLPDLLRYYGL